jgi:hypothetical protein
MTTQIIIEHNIATGEIIQREMTPEEIDPTLTWSNEEKAKALEIQEAEATKATEKAALLSKLGITAEEAKLLLS